MQSPGIPVERVMPAQPRKAVTEELIISKLADGTYRVGWFCTVDEKHAKGTGGTVDSREKALALAEELLR